MIKFQCQPFFFFIILNHYYLPIFPYFPTALPPYMSIFIILVGQFVAENNIIIIDSLSIVDIVISIKYGRKETRGPG